jgi:signal peptidase II
MRWRAPLFLLTLLAAAGCDQATKHVAREVLAGSPAVSLAAGLVRFELALNPGGFLSFGASLPDEIRSLFFLAVVPLGLLLVCVLLLRAGPLDRAALVGLGLVAGGGLANWIDRLVAGAVTDFVSLGVGGLRTGIFNVADVSVLAGVAVLLLAARPSAGAPPGPQPTPNGSSVEAVREEA